MAEQETTEAIEDEIEPIKEWHFDWPQGPMVDTLSVLRDPLKWFEKLDTDTDALGEIGHALAQLMKGDKIPSPDQLDTFVRHPLLEEKTIRYCNLIFQSQAGTRLNELSRAVVLLGAKTVRNLLFVASVINRLLVEPTPKALLPEIVRMILSGIYATIICQRLDEKLLNAEEIFVAGSLQHLGRSLALYFGGGNGKLLEKKMQVEKRTLDDSLFEEVFEFKPALLSQVCAKRWFLGDTLNDYLAGKQQSENDAIRLASDLTDGLFRGHHSPEFIAAQKELGTLLSLDADGLQDFVLEGLERVIEGLSLYDCPDLLEYVPYPKEDEPEQTDASKEEFIEFKGEPNPEIIQATVQSLVKLPLTKEPDEATFIETVLEGLSCGCDFDRVAVFMLDKEKKWAKLMHQRQIGFEQFKERFEIEVEVEDYFTDLAIDLRAQEGFLLRNILRENKIAWVGPASSAVIRKLRNNALNKCVGRGQFFIAPIAIQKEKIGFYFCDRQISHRKLDIKSFDGFTDICLSANKALEMLRDNP